MRVCGQSKLLRRARRRLPGLRADPSRGRHGFLRAASRRRRSRAPRLAVGRPARAGLPAPRAERRRHIRPGTVRSRGTRGRGTAKPARGAPGGGRHQLRRAAGGPDARGRPARRAAGHPAGHERPSPGSARGRLRPPPRRDGARRSQRARVRGARPCCSPASAYSRPFCSSAGSSARSTACGWPPGRWAPAISAHGSDGVAGRARGARARLRRHGCAPRGEQPPARGAGSPRPAHGARQPPPLPGGARPGARARAARWPPACGGAARRGRLQARERVARPPVRR